MQFKYSYSSLSKKKKKKIHIVKLVVTSFVYLFDLYKTCSKWHLKGKKKKKEKERKKLTRCFIWLLAGHYEITHSVRSKESVDKVLIL